MKPAREPASNCPKLCASLKNAPRILPICRSLLALVGRKQTWSEISFSLRNLPVRAFDSRAQRFSSPLARRRSSCPPPLPVLVRTYPIDGCCALPSFPRQCPLPLACHHLPKGANLELERDLMNTILNQPYRRCVSANRLNREDSQLAASLEGESGHTPAGKTLPYSLSN